MNVLGDEELTFMGMKDDNVLGDEGWKRFKGWRMKNEDLLGIND